VRRLVVVEGVVVEEEEELDEVEGRGKGDYKGSSGLTWTVLMPNW